MFIDSSLTYSRLRDGTDVLRQPASYNYILYSAHNDVFPDDSSPQPYRGMLRRIVIYKLCFAVEIANVI